MEFTILLIALLMGGIALVGSVMPGPGPPLAYVGMLLLQWQIAPTPFSATTLWVLGILTAITLVIDYVLPVWIGKKFGAGKYGVWGSIIGMIVGLFFGPWGMIIGVFVGAVAGEYYAHQNTTVALKAGMGTFVGTVLTIVLKLTLTTVMFFYIFGVAWAMIWEAIKGLF